MDDKARSELIAHTAQIVAAYAAHNQVADLPALMRQVFETLHSLQSGERHHETHTGHHPAVPVKKSVMPDYIVCLEDGKKLKMLKRHLKTAYNMTPEQYREKWGLPPDYPMVAPKYAEKRSNLAREIGLGTSSTSGGKSAGGK